MAADPTTSAVRESVVINAPAEEVFQYFTDAEAMLEWMGQAARLDPRPGGEFAVEIDGSAVRGRYLLIDPPMRVVFTWGFLGSEQLPPGTSTVEVMLTETADGIRVDLVHYGLPNPQRAEHANGWRRFLACLRAACEPRAGRGARREPSGQWFTRTEAPAAR